ncbi:MAG TPA: NDP-sugar synthase [Solirubrobacteraceae bacterium]|nr:NDP-sugar synthase [Solirubrobacteraceae bacterium]
MQALILAGGEGTRLRPLTSTIPKPVVPLVGRPFISYMLRWLHEHGVEDVILGCGFMADQVRGVLGDGSGLGIRLRYLEEPRPLGTGGALKFAEDLLDDRFFMLNGDVLTDIDLTEQLAQHERTGARATLALYPVDDPSAYGLVRLDADGSVNDFVEKPGPEELDTNLISAGAYILERDVLEGMAPAGTNISIERDVFPTLIGRGLYGYEASGYWLDIGTPDRYLKGTYDILEGKVNTDVGRQLRASGLVLVDGAKVEGRAVAPVLVGSGSSIGARALVGDRSALGEGVTVGEDARVESSVLLDGVSVGASTTISGSIVGTNATIGDHCHIGGGVVVGERVRIGSGNMLAAGARIFPGVELPDGAIRF